MLKKWILLILLCFFFLSCEEKEEKPEPQPANQIRKGVSLSPRSYDSTDFVEFFSLADSAGEIVMWAGDWAELENSSGAPAVVAALASTYHYTPLIIGQFFNQSTGALLRPWNDSTRNLYLSGAASFARRFHPEFLGFGIEVNMLYEQSPQDFDSFAVFFPRVCDSVKANSPSTKVFTVFQIEKMKGLNGGLFGGVNDTSQTEWFLLDRFPESDAVAFTTYPALVFRDPTEIPGDYYERIRSFTARDIFFTEIGWHSAASPSGWESSEGEQASFITRYFELTTSLQPRMAIWTFLYDPDTDEPFNSMGLRRRSDGGSKAAWRTWIEAR